MIKILMIVLIAGALLSTASAMRDVESPEEALPILQDLGEKSYKTVISTIDYAQSLIDIWHVEEEIDETETEESI